RHVGPREVEWVQHNFRYDAATKPGMQDVPELVDGHHGQPGEEECRPDEKGLEEPVQGWSSLLSLGDFGDGPEAGPHSARINKWAMRELNPRLHGVSMA